MKREIKRAFTTAELKPVHNFTVDCLTWVLDLGQGQPLRSIVFRWFCGQATIGFNGLQWSSTIAMHWSSDGMVAYHRRSLDPPHGPINDPQIKIKTSSHGALEFPHDHHRADYDTK